MLYEHTKMFSDGALLYEAITCVKMRLNSKEAHIRNADISYNYNMHWNQGRLVILTLNYDNKKCQNCIVFNRRPSMPVIKHGGHAPIPAVFLPLQQWMKTLYKLTFSFSLKEQMSEKVTNFKLAYLKNARVDSSRLFTVNCPYYELKVCKISALSKTCPGYIRNFFTTTWLRLIRYLQK